MSAPVRCSCPPAQVSAYCREHGLSLLGRTVLGAGTPASITADQLETFPCPEGLRRVTMRSDEFTALCPVTSQPDWYEVAIEYGPRERCLESKALKLYLQRFRSEGVFCEALAARIAAELCAALDANYVEVTLTQKARGGVSIEAVAVAVADRPLEPSAQDGP